MSQARRLSYLLLINIAMIAGLVSVGIFSHSLGVLASGGDFAADSLAIALGLLAVHLRDHHDNQKATTYVALVNGLLLLGVTIFVLVEAVRRLTGGTPEIHGLPVLLVATISTVAMAAGALILGRNASKEDLHMRSVLLDTISDGLSAVAVAVVGGIIYFTHSLYWLDAWVAIAISIYIAFGAVRLLRDVASSLLHGSALEVGDN